MDSITTHTDALKMDSMDGHDTVLRKRTMRILSINWAINTQNLKVRELIQEQQVLVK
jgi:hypothetical protein